MNPNTNNYQRNNNFIQDDKAASYERNVSLIYKLAQRIYRRVLAAHLPMTFEDVQQEVSIAWFQASKKFDPMYGTTFSTYFAKAAYSHLNRLIKKESNYYIELHTVSFEGASVDGEEYKLEERIPTGELTPEQEIIQLDEFGNLYEKLTPYGQKIIDWVLNPPAFLLKEIEKRNCKSDYVKSTGRRTRSTSLSLRTATDIFGKCMGLTDSQRNRVRRELTPIAEYI